MIGRWTDRINPFRRAVIQESDQLIEIPPHVEQPHRLHVVIELRPRGHLEYFLQRAKSPGERDKAVREVGHHRLPGVHAVDHEELRQARVGELATPELLGNHPDHLPARRERPVRHRPHHPHAPAAEHDRNIQARQVLAHRARRLQISRIDRRARPAVHAKPLELSHAPL
jgi:hypothetical protein